MQAIYHGNCLDELKKIPDNSIDSIVTDPPYGLKFMGKKWDYDVPTVEIWEECLRVLKPGGHLLAFSGTRTQHRMAVNIEDAGFEIRDMVTYLYDTNDTAAALMESLTQEQIKMLDAAFGRDGMLGWVYGSGFPKSMDVSKAIDKAAGAEREVIGTIDPRSSFDGRERKSSAINTNWRGAEGRNDVRDLSKKQITAPATEKASEWQGWGTALKPALEPITVARKPFKGTVAANVLTHGTGAINIDGCRVGDATGRWPANLCHDGSNAVEQMLPAQAGAAAPVHTRSSDKFRNAFGTFKGNIDEQGSTFQGDSGSAARFFYCAKASRKDRNEGLQDPGPQFKHGATLRKVENTDTKGNNHPTVKPTELMAYLCRLVTPPGGVVLDPFMGSGSTGKAAIREGFGFIGIEMDADYCEIARARIQHEVSKMEAANA